MVAPEVPQELDQKVFVLLYEKILQVLKRMNVLGNPMSRRPALKRVDVEVDSIEDSLD